MPATRECPLCAGTMTIKETKTVTQILGNPTPTTRLTREWVCRDCDYFEEVEEESSR
jgi:hypothetical protein